MATATLTATKDASMAKRTTDDLSAWNGHDNHLAVGADGSFRVRPVVFFSLSWQLTNTIFSLTSATLRMTFSNNANHNVQSSAPTSVKVARMTKDWGEGSPDPGEGEFTSQAAWSWNTRHDAFSNSGSVTQNVTQTSEDTTVDFDVTDIVQDWLEGTANYGFMISNESSEVATNKSIQFFSSDQSNATRKPKLILDYVANTAPNEVVNMSPTGDQVVNTLTPTFSFTRDDPDADDYISFYVVYVLEDGYGGEVPVPSDDIMWRSDGVATTGKPTTVTVQYGNPAGSVLRPLISGTFYKWFVWHYDKGSEGSPFPGTISRFKVNSPPHVPDVVVPTPITDIPDTTPTFSVVHSDPDPNQPTMYGYRVVVEQETSLGASDWTVEWDSGDVDTSGSPATTKQVTSGTLDWGGSFRVKARTKDSDGAWSGYSPYQAFQIHKTATPISLDPSGSETTPLTPVFTGSRGSNVDTITSYWIRVFTDDLQTTMLSETEYTTGITSGSTFSKSYAGSALSASTAYQYQVRLVSSVGGTSDWSALQRFVTVSATVPTVVSPVGENSYTLTPTVTIDRVSTFNRVQFEVYPSTSTTDNLGTVHYASGTISANIAPGGLGTRYSATYAGTALTWDTLFKIRARVSSDGGTNWSDWSGLVSFRTSSAGVAVLTSVAGDTGTMPWITDTTPDFVITRSGSDTIDKAQVRVWDANGTTLLWDSGLVDVANATTATVTYAGSSLPRWLIYSWDARYQSTAGPTGPYAAKKQFKFNGISNVPTFLYPPSAHVFNTVETVAFQAFFSDSDVEIFDDEPTEWEVEVQLSDGTPFDIETDTTGLIVGLNTMVWAGTALTAGDYQWRTRFKDTKGEWGWYSGWQSFSVAAAPNGTITTPTNGSNLATVTPQISWSYTGGTQERFTVRIDETDSSGAFLKSITELGPVFSASTSYDIPAGYLKDAKYYDITLTVWNTSNLVDPTPSSVNVRVLLDAPNPITGLFPTGYDNLSLVVLEWDAASLKAGHTFVSYRIYKRLVNDDEFDFVADVEGINTTTYNEWYAGNTVQYEYRVVAVTTKTGVNVDMESPDDPDGGNLTAVLLNDDNWVIVGADRLPDHIYDLIVDTESHNRPIQQEVFETLGSSRKVIMRGFVLGHEGTIDTFWQNADVALPSDSQVFYNETVIGRRIVDYLTYNAGPHILKSPFGDVWDVEFTTPEYEWQSVGHLRVTLNWIETGATSVESI